MSKPTLDDILSASDPLLEVKVSAPAVTSEHQRILDTFGEINTFIDRHGRKPGDQAKPSVSERSLRLKLNGLLADPGLHAVLSPHDKHGLLPAAPAVVPQSLDDILDADEALLSTPEDGIFDLVHVKAPVARPDEIAERQLCKDFAAFEPLFASCVEELARGDRNMPIPLVPAQLAGI